ncbi:phage terminase small subunit P27 family [Bradyrhizobium sp. 24]|uniref:phage terminase small subunit P27 family n=1 Tax=unclassified Bradyrhizobium TaxID=2631580 RepID=UPI001FFBA719|nr:MULTISPECIES: phage terminase small subunit P27 family [unclassified Bradyrhizobium]MCK1303899.1 phage terminase small subunit P27 family [Bradyrhizobium sp. 37]MCK1382496.1 phage terminase small subunit P27 family [Bradyrhizobium sp. 24]MCK1770417.1 phage terminase small subunit P27 family [Bradyrhizobium sp. 134]
MAGPPPTPTHLKLLRGNPGKRRLHPEPEPQIAKVCPEPPPFITGYAADEWWTVAPGLHRLGLLTTVDVAALSAYCYAYAQWRQAAEALARMADRDETMHGLLVKTVDGNARRNPLVKIANDAAEDMLRYAGEFGLTPIARTRLGAAGYAAPSPPSKFDGLLAGTVVPMRRGDE